MGGIFWLASYPKSGNTWFRSFLSNLTADANEPVDINELHTGSIASARAWLDEVLGFDSSELTFDELDALRAAVYDWTLQDEEVGHHKIHDAYTYLPNGDPLVGKRATLGALYVLRNPLDVAPSYANHNHSTIDAAIKSMSDPGHCLAGGRKGAHEQVRQQLLSWSKHVLSWVDAPDLSCHVIRYEDMLAEPMQTFSQATHFLGLSFPETRIEKAIRFSDFKELAAQERAKGFRERPPKTAQFFRQGKSGNWRSQLTSAQVQRILDDHGQVMGRFGYLDSTGQPV